MVLLVALLVGCAGSDDPLCREGTTLEADGHCYPPILEFPPGIDELIEALPPCEPLPVLEAHAIDVARGCASGACAGDTYQEMLAVLGDEDHECQTTPFDNRRVYCTWEELGIDGLFEDEDRNRVPDPGEGTERIRVFDDYPGATDDGVGVNVPLSCYFEHIGTPTRLNWIDAGGELAIQDVLYDQYGLFAYDFGDDDDSGLPNGIIDNLYLYGN